MKFKLCFTLLFLSLLITSFTSNKINNKENSNMENKKNDSLLRHVVLFKFKDNTPSEKIKEIEEAFKNLPNKIPQIQGYEWGLNNSPENLNKGFTHCFLLTFKSETDRDIYLPHPDHKAFGAILTPYLEDVLVVDYWSN
jgi:tRNA/tmRNA/rRNA uracil-C5-methylase (TrmA/RlmC/RlmD family)